MNLTCISCFLPSNGLQWRPSGNHLFGTLHLGGTRTLLGAKGIATRSKKARTLPGAPGHTTRNKDATNTIGVFLGRRPSLPTSDLRFALAGKRKTPGACSLGIVPRRTAAPRSNERRSCTRFKRRDGRNPHHWEEVRGSLLTVIQRSTTKMSKAKASSLF